LAAENMVSLGLILFTFNLWPCAC